MKRRLVAASFIGAWLIGVVVYMLYPVTMPDEPLKVLQASSGNARSTGQEASQEIPPPPSTAEPPLSPPRSDPSRTLIGITNEQLRQIELSLPEGARVATYPVNESHLKAAVTKADLDNDGNIETVVVHTKQPPTSQEPTPQLFLSILAYEGEELEVRSSTRLFHGGVLFDINLDGINAPLAVRDVTGDRRPQIIVATGMGASLGGALQVYSVEGASLHQVANLDGHFFNVRSRGIGRPSVLTVQSRYETKPTAYKWNGQKFEMNTSGR